MSMERATDPARAKVIAAMHAEDTRRVRSELQALTDQVWSSRPHPLSATLWRWDGGAWAAASQGRR